MPVTKPRSTHYDWLGLMEISGPFLSASVLDEAFPAGLDGLDRRVKRELSVYYGEWVDAFETASPQFPELHRAWLDAVLRVGLRIPGDALVPGGGWQVLGEGGVGAFSPDLALLDDTGQPALFVKFLPAAAKPNGRDGDSGWKDTFVEKMTRLCRAHGTRLGLVSNGEQWVLVNAVPAGALSGAATWHARLWFQEDETLRAFVSLLGWQRFSGAREKRLPRLLDESLAHLEEVTDTLGAQVATAVEVLLEGFDRADLDSGRQWLSGVSPATLYEASLTVMMRLVFLLCAEERGLLLLGESAWDDAYAVSTLRKRLEEDADRFGPEVLERRYDAWARLLAAFRAVYAGIEHPSLRLPARGGSLFDPDRFPFLEGRPKDLGWQADNPPPLPIDNRTVLLLLESLQVLKRKNGAVQLSFRSLDVEQIGYIYEGLLESTAARAEEILLGLKGGKSRRNPEIPLAELESLALDSREKLLARVQEATGHTAVAREFDAPPDPALLPRLEKACRGDKALEARIRPFLNWMRASEWGDPVVVHKGSFYVTAGRDRRSSGTHYTPKALTETIVKEALEPVVYDGPAAGTPRAGWQLKSPAELLDLKICDPAMGSGAFLVQACRYLADRLVDAWEIAEMAGKAIDADGSVAEAPPRDPMDKTEDARLAAARRLVAEKCLYGVDVNPLAVELAKLSLWLVTISKDRPFGFLDHNLKSGDSLLGVTAAEQLAQFRMKPVPRAAGNLNAPVVRKALEEAAAERKAIRDAKVRDISDVRLQMVHHEAAQKLTFHVRRLADFFTGTLLALGKPAKKTPLDLDAAAMNGAVLLEPETDSFKAAQCLRDARANLAFGLPPGQTEPRRPFHWAIEFPEVFARGGFDAIVGNPPFMGGKLITGNYGTAYRDYLLHYLADGAKGSADLVAYFYLRAFSLLHSGGDFGLVACNTIAEGDTRQVGLERMVKAGGTIYSAYPNMPWPGVAAVVISLVFMTKKTWRGSRGLNGREVATISPFLSSQDEWSPRVLTANANQSFQGSVVLGLGFTMSEDAAKGYISADPKNAEVLFPYLNGDDLNSSPEQKPSRWVINFFDWPLDRDAEGSWLNSTDKEKKEFFNLGHVPSDYPGKVVSSYPQLYEVISEMVRPERQRLDENGDFVLRRPLPIRWWQYADKRPALYHSIGRGDCFARHPKGWRAFPKLSRVIVTSLVQSYLKFAIVSNDSVFAHKLGVITREELFPILTSLIFNVWARKTSSTMGYGINFSPSDSYETFPFPLSPLPQLESLGEQFDAHRHKIMRARQIGLTTLYNLFHNPGETDAELEEMRRLQREIDIAVRNSYGWQDIDLEHGFYEIGYLSANDNIRYAISEPARLEILSRLSALNRLRWEEEEKAGLHKKNLKQ